MFLLYLFRLFISTEDHLFLFHKLLCKLFVVKKEYINIVFVVVLLNFMKVKRAALDRAVYPGAALSCIIVITVMMLHHFWIWKRMAVSLHPCSFFSSFCTNLWLLFSHCRPQALYCMEAIIGSVEACDLAAQREAKVAPMACAQPARVIGCHHPRKIAFAGRNTSQSFISCYCVCTTDSKYLMIKSFEVSTLFSLKLSYLCCIGQSQEQFFLLDVTKLSNFPGAKPQLQYYFA